MNEEEKKGPGRPKKYADAKERKRAYRERKKAEITKLETRAKKITELQDRVDDMEKRLIKSSVKRKNLPPEYIEIHEQIKARSMKYAPSELTEMDIDQLKRIRDSINSRYYGSLYNPLLSALESAIMPSVDREFDSRKLMSEDVKAPRKEIEEKLAQIRDKSTPITEQKIDEYILKLKEQGVSISDDDELAIRSTMEKRNGTKPKDWKHLKDPYRTEQLFNVIQELILLYAVEAEIARRERDDTFDVTIEKLERRILELEKVKHDDKLLHVKTFVNKMATKEK